MAIVGSTEKVGYCISKRPSVSTHVINLNNLLQCPFLCPVVVISQYRRRVSNQYYKRVDNYSLTVHSETISVALLDSRIEKLLND